MQIRIKLVFLITAFLLTILSCVNSKFETGQYHKFIDNEDWHSDEIESCNYSISKISGSDSTKIIFQKTNLPGQGQAQPLIRTILRKPENRVYVVSVQKCNKQNELCFEILPDSAKVGLIGHELVHVQDYKTKGFFSIVWMGIKYSISRKYRTRVEYITDSTTIANSMGYEVLSLINFVKNSGIASQKYLKMKNKYYMDAKEIQKIIELTY